MKSKSLFLLFAVGAVAVMIWMFGRPKAPERTSRPAGSSASQAGPEDAREGPGVSAASSAPLANASGPVPAGSPPLTTAARQDTVPAEAPALTTPGGVSPSMAGGVLPIPTDGTPTSDPAMDAVVDPEKIAQDLDHLSLGLRDYRTLMAQNPVGNNAEITKALRGGNPKGAQLAPDDIRTNAKGESVDRWGTPYFFHQMSATSMEIHSAGPDRKMGTDDDIILR